jgi:ComF family protein
MSVIDRLLSVVAPYQCLNCQIESLLLCNKCALSLPTGAKNNNYSACLNSITSVTAYKGVARDLIWRLKSAGVQAAADLMARQMTGLVPVGTQLLVPVPTATSRVRRRGYDQAGLLTKALSRHSGIPRRNCLIRIKQTQQVGAPRSLRQQQVKGAFRCQAGNLDGRRVLLVDDVVTTGATLEEAALVLKKAGAATVDAITFAQA